MWFFKRRKGINSRTTESHEVECTAQKACEEKEEKNSPPEIMRLGNYFKVVISKPFYYQDDDKVSIGFLSKETV